MIVDIIRVLDEGQLNFTTPPIRSDADAKRRLVLDLLYLIRHSL